MMREQDSVNKTTFPNGIRLDMFNPDGSLGSTLTSKYGEMDHLTNQMIAKDSVVVYSTNGQSLRCKDLVWKQNERMLSTYGKVALQTPTEIIYGDTLFADENLKIYRIKKVTGIAQVKK
jgi:LPS export ABC transporter protein LptC